MTLSSILTLWCLAAFGNFQEKIPESHMALRGNFSGLLCATDPVKVSKDTASLLVGTLKSFFV